MYKFDKVLFLSVMFIVAVIGIGYTLGGIFFAWLTRHDLALTAIYLSVGFAALFLLYNMIHRDDNLNGGCV